MSKIDLSVYCLAFNHEKYIRKTLDGFVHQKTEYRYQVFVHDDASTDGTADIIHEYSQKYPDIIFPIYQTENQYSKRIPIFQTYIAPHLKGKYLAICEGDDYWCDENKIQAQISYMEKNPQCRLCVHNTKMIRENGGSKHRLFNYSWKDRDYTTADVIEAGGGGLFHTSSFLMRLDDRLNMPEDMEIPGIGDYSLAMWLSTLGYVHYIAKTMSVYRVGSINSWVKKNEANKAREIDHNKIVVKSLHRMDQFCDGKYHTSFQKIIDRYNLNSLLIQNKYGEVVTNSIHRRSFLQLPFRLMMKEVAKMIGCLGKETRK